jgi:serine/threonine protein kinase
MKTIEPGTTFDGKYEILAVLGSGGVGTVYKAQEKELNRTVAIKLLHIWTSSLGEHDSLQRFKREAQVLCQLFHPNILRVYRFGMTENGLPFLVMEYVEGESLRSLLEKYGPIEYCNVARIALKLAAALKHAHEHGIVHRDLKPENVIVDLSEPADPIVKLIDFGLCKPEQNTSSTNQRTLTNTGDLLGTALYMSPEQVLGQPVTERSDIYAFALIVFEMIVGKGPFSEGNVAEIMMRRTSEQMPEILSINPACGLPKQFDDLLQACAAREPDRRPQSVGEIIELLRSVPVTVPGKKYFPPDKSFLPTGKKSAVFLLPAAATVTVAGVLLYFLLSTAGGGSVAVKMPEQIISSSVAEIKGKLQKKDFEGAQNVAKASITKDVESWPASQRANLYYYYFEVFRDAGELKTAQIYIPRFFKATFPMLLKKGNEPPDWSTRIKTIYDFLHKEEIDRNTWRALNVALTADGSLRKMFLGDRRTEIYLRELEIDSELRIWEHPKLTAISDYAKQMTELAALSGQLGFEDLYKYYYEISNGLIVKHRFKRFDVLLAEAACQRALARNDIVEAVRQMKRWQGIIKEIDASPDLKDLKPSAWQQLYELENEVETALSKQAVAKGDKKAAQEHANSALKAKELVEQYEKLLAGKPSIKGLVVDELSK